MKETELVWIIADHVNTVAAYFLMLEPTQAMIAELSLVPAFLTDGMGLPVI